MREPRYHRVSLAAATSQLHVELEGSHGKLSGIDLRGHNRSHGAPRTGPRMLAQPELPASGWQAPAARVGPLRTLGWADATHSCCAA